MIRKMARMKCDDGDVWRRFQRVVSDNTYAIFGRQENYH